MAGELLVLALACLVVGSYGANENVTVGKRVVKATDVPGKIELYNSNNMTNAVSISFVSVKEIDSNNTEIAAHSVNDFSQIMFTLSAKQDMNYPSPSLPATKFSMSADLVVDAANNLTATLTAEIWVFKTNGTTAQQVDGYDIYAGDVKVNVMVKNWTFCDPASVTCTSGDGQTNLTGQFVDVTIKVKGMKPATLKSGTTMMYTLGGWSSYRASNKVMSDGSATTVNMPTGYPMNTIVSGDDLFTARLPKFSTSATYGNIISLGRFKHFFDSVVIKTLGQSGKTQYYSTDNPDKKVTIEFRDLQEKTADGKKISTPKGHAFNGFASTAFTIEDLGEEKFQSLDVKRTRFHAPLNKADTGDTGATLTVNTYLFMDDGTVTYGNDTYNMRAGTMKFDVQVSGWKFCGRGSTECKQGNDVIVGDSLDFEILIKGSGDKVEKNNTAGSGSKDEYDLGDAKLVLSNFIMVDDVGKTMADGYPKPVQVGSKMVFQFRFPPFDTKVFYDPTVEGLGGEGGSGGNGTGAGSYVTASYAILVIALFFSVNKLWM